MATWMAHLRIAEELLGRIDYLEEKEFIMGSMAPDSGVPNADWSAFTPNKNVSHFKSIGADGKKSIDVEKYVDQHFTRELCRNYTKKQFSFYFGYYAHLLSDVLWHKEILEKSIEADKEAYEKNRTELVWKWKEDWYDLDFLYLRDHPDFYSFWVFKNAEGFQNTYLDIFSEDALDNRREYIVGFYSEKRENLDREYPYLSREKMEAFVEHAADFVMKSYFSLIEKMMRVWQTEQTEWNDNCRWTMTKYNRALNREVENEKIYLELLKSALEEGSAIKIASSHYGLIRHYLEMKKYEQAYEYFESFKEKGNFEYIKEEHFYLYQHILREVLRLVSKYSEKAEAIWEDVKPLLVDELERMRLDLYPAAIVAAESVNDPYVKELEHRYSVWKSLRKE